MPGGVYPVYIARADTTEVIDITTTDGSAKAGSFSTLSVSSAKPVRDVLIQNISAYNCYVAWGISAVTATTGSTKLLANDTIRIDNCSFAYFSVLREGSNNVTVRITGIGG